MSCPICMEHPHKAVLLICSSHEKGCRPFICDTSYRHSNCFDQFCKLHGLSPSKSTSTDQSKQFLTLWKQKGPWNCMPSLLGKHPWLDCGPKCLHIYELKNTMLCPESCDFSGNYDELRKHAQIQTSMGEANGGRWWEAVCLEQNDDRHYEFMNHYLYQRIQLNFHLHPYRNYRISIHNVAPYDMIT